jgi:kumamolisin
VQPLRPEHLGKQIEFQIALRMRNFPKLLARLAAGERVPRDEMEARYLPLPADYQATLLWAQSQGLTISGTDPLRLGLFVKGTVAQIQNATRAQFAEVTANDGTYTSAITAPSLPEGLSPAILGVNGLQPQIHPHHLSSGLQPQLNNAPPYLVKEIEGAYDATNLGYNGQGQTIAILIDTFPESTDLTQFWTHNGIAQSLSNIDEIQAVAGTLDAVTGEETLDTEWTSGIASGADIRIYATTDLSFTDLDKGLERIISDLPDEPSMQQLSISLGLGETEVSSAQKTTDSQYFAMIANFGVTIFVASGDDGSELDGAEQPSYYASDPSVTGVGGTTLDLYSSGQVSVESAWDGSGGGTSSFFSRPAWQVGAGVPGGTQRLVPDVASAADPNTGAYVYLQGAARQIGGTSWAAPTWAGFCAIINEARSQSGLGPVGMLNPRIYPLIGSSCFRDVTQGSNGDYNAGSGYDEVTGIGTPQVGALLSSLTAGGGTNPAIISFGPNAGAVGSTVSINGVNLDHVTSVEFNGTPALFTINSAASITGTVPAGATTGPIELISGTGTVFTSVNQFFVVNLPTNDAFADATVLSGTQGQVNGSNISATVEPSEPATVAGSPIGASVWWVWQAPATATFTFSTAGSSFDTTEAIYTGNAVNALTEVGANDDYGTGVTSSVTFNATQGATYYIQIAGYQALGSAAATGAITLTWEENAAVPVIDSFTPQAGTPGTAVSVTGEFFLGTQGVTVGGTSTNFNVVSDTNITFNVPQGATTGPIGVAGALGTTYSTANFVVVAPVPNDNFDNATVIAGPSGAITGNNVGATRQAGEPEIDGNPGGASIWYEWTPSFSGQVTFTTFGSSFDTLLGVYTGVSVTALTQIAANDGYGNTANCSVTFQVNAGTTYHIAVDGFDGATGNTVLNWSKNSSLPVVSNFSPNAGPVGTPLIITGSAFTGATSVALGNTPMTYQVVSDSEITATVPAGAGTSFISVGNFLGTVNSSNVFTVTAAPVNDTFATRIPLTGSVVHTTGASVGAGLENGDGDIAGNPGGERVWWTWTPPVTGVYAISTAGSNFDTLLGVYTGSSLNALSLVASNDDDPSGGVTSYLTMTATAGTPYQIAVDGLNGADGTVSLSIYPQQASMDLYSTGFEPKEGFTAGTPLGGQDGWEVQGTGGTGIVVGEDGMSGQQAYVGHTAPTTGGDTGVTAYYPVDYSPVGSLEPIVTFSTTMAINDSTNSNYDDFLWRLVDSKGRVLFSIDFANGDLQVYYYLDGARQRVATGVQFANNTPLKLVVTMDYSTDKWSATLNGAKLAANEPIHIGTDLLDFGYMAAAWQIANPSAPGDNSMVFDDYSIVAGQNPAPKISFQPQSQSVVTGNNATLGVVATGEAPLYYQWFVNKAAIPGAVGSNLTIANVQASNAGSYTVQVSNPAGLVTSTPAVLTVTPQTAIPIVTENPPSMTVAAGATALFQSAATGYPAPTYQWYYNGSPILHATKASLSVVNAQAANSGTYSVVASNVIGSGTGTPPAVLTIGKSFKSQAGLFNGMIFNGVNDFTGSGEIKVTLGAAGTFTGSVSLAGATYSMAGTLNSQGAWSGVVGRGFGFLPIVVNLQLALSGSNEITGTVTIGSTVETTTALRDDYVKTTNPAPEVAAYTMTLTSTSASMPQGIGYAAVTVDKAGNVHATGKLGDNTAFTVASVLSDSGAWPFYLPLYNKTGYIGGTMTFTGTTGTGALYWTRPASGGFGGFSSGFNGNVAVAAYSYTPPAARTPAIPLGVSHTGAITFTGAVLSSTVTGPLSINSAGTLLSGNSAIKLTLTPATGVFSGTVKAGFAQPVPFGGVLIQSLDEGTGLFQTPTLSGEVQITSP